VTRGRREARTWNVFRESSPGRSRSDDVGTGDSRAGGRRADYDKPIVARLPAGRLSNSTARSTIRASPPASASTESTSVSRPVFRPSTTTDGRIFFLANGRVRPARGRKLHISYKQPSLLYRNRGMTLRGCVAGSGPGYAGARSRGCAIGDLDNTEIFEIVVNNTTPRPRTHRRRRPIHSYRPDRNASSKRHRRACQSDRRRPRPDRQDDNRALFPKTICSCISGAGTPTTDVEVSWPSGTKDVLEISKRII